MLARGVAGKFQAVRTPARIGQQLDYLQILATMERLGCYKLSCCEAIALKLCKKEGELIGHSLCAAGCSEDSKGYWMASAAKRCSSVGYNRWSGTPGSFCCVEWMERIGSCHNTYTTVVSPRIAQPST